MKYLLSIVIVMMGVWNAHATFETWDGSQTMSGINSQSDSIFIGPSAVLSIPAGGKWNIFSEYVYIHPNARISGDGLLIFRDPIQASLPASTLKIDGGGALIDVNIIFENESNMELTQIIAPAILGWSAAEGAGQDNLYIGRDFLFNTIVDGIALPTVPIDNNHVILGAHDVIFDANATISGYREDAYFVTASTGNVVKEALNGSFTFPVGFTETTGGVDYTPAEITDSGGATFEVSVADYSAATSSCSINEPEEGVGRTWEIFTSTGSAAGATLNLQHNTNSNGTLYDASSSQFITRCVGTAPNNDGGAISETEWDFVGNPSCSTESGTGTLTTGSNVPNGTELSRSGLTNFTTYTHYTKSVCDVNPLPVTFGKVWAINDCDSVIINWETLSESNNSHFEIEKSQDGIQFVTVGRVEGSGNSSQLLTYRYEEATINGIWYYRVRQVDFDGQTETTDIIRLRIECAENETIIYPNPAQSQTSIHFIARNNEDVVFSVFANNGQLLLVNKRNVERGEVVSHLLHVDSLASGVYILHIQQGSFIETKKLIVQ